MSRLTFDAKAEELRSCLPDASERTAAQLMELYRAPTPERCERMGLELDGLRTLCLRMRQALVLEGEGHER